jgi:uncharacterized membrane protein
MKPAIKNNTKSKDPSKRTFYDRDKLLMELLPLFFIILMFGIAFYAYPHLPPKIPTHWNASGQADGFNEKNSVFFIPILFLILCILFFILPIMEVFRDNMLKIYKYYYWFKIFFGLFFLVLFIATLLPNFGYDINVAYIVISMICVLFIGLGFVLPKLKRNFMFGIRTGWTLSSDKVWDETHKIGGALFIFVGVITIILSLLLRLEVLFFAFIGLVLSVSLFLVFYSYHLYKNDMSTKK